MPGPHNNYKLLTKLAGSAAPAAPAAPELAPGLRGLLNRMVEYNEIIIICDLIRVCKWEVAE